MAAERRCVVATAQRHGTWVEAAVRVRHSDVVSAPLATLRWGSTPGGAHCKAICPETQPTMTHRHHACQRLWPRNFVIINGAPGKVVWHSCPAQAAKHASAAYLYPRCPWNAQNVHVKMRLRAMWQRRARQMCVPQVAAPEVGAKVTAHCEALPTAHQSESGTARCSQQIR